MRDDWQRTSAVLDLTADELNLLTRPVFPGRSVVEHEIATGGLANTNIRVRLSGMTKPLLLRLYTRDPVQAGKEHRLNGLASQHGVPVPRFFHAADTNPVTGHPYAVMEWIAGERLERVAADTRGRDGIAALGRPVGAALARIHAITFQETGFLDRALKVRQPASVGSDGLRAYLHACLIDGRGGDRLGPDQTRRLMTFAEAQGPLLDAWSGPPCLVHSDFGGSNILMRPSGSGWTAAAVLDWEFAFSGSPFFDFGNLLRPPLGDRDGFAAAVAEGYVGAGGVLHPEWRRMARLVDLLAWADFLNRPDTGPAVIRDARRAIVRTIDEWSA